MEAHWDFGSTFGATWSILGLHFGAYLISEGRAAWRFSMYLALPQIKTNKQAFVNNYTAKAKFKFKFQFKFAVALEAAREAIALNYYWL